MVDANQAWDVGEAIEHVRALAPYRPLWIEEPTSPDDVLGHAAIRARGRPASASRRASMRESRDLQAAPAGGGDRLLPARQLPPGRPQRSAGGAAAGGEVRRARLPARRRHRPVRVRAARIDHRLHLRQRQLEGRATRVRRPPARALRRPGGDPRARYMPPAAPGFSIEMRPESLDEFEFPGGAAWRLLSRELAVSGCCYRARRPAPWPPTTRLGGSATGSWNDSISDCHSRMRGPSPCTRPVALGLESIGRLHHHEEPPAQPPDQHPLDADAASPRSTSGQTRGDARCTRDDVGVVLQVDGLRVTLHRLRKPSTPPSIGYAWPVMNDASSEQR